MAAYLRISKSDPASSSIEKQRDNIARLVDRRFPGAKIHEFVDEGVSATKAKTRPAFTRLSDRLSDFDYVVFDRQDRVARKPLDFWTFAAEAERHGTAVIGASEDLDLSTADGEMTAGIRLTVARAEARRTADRIKATNVYRRRSGVRAIGGPPVFGLRRQPDNRDHFEPDPERAPLVLEAIDGVLAGKASVSSITTQWTLDGVPTARGGAAWSTRAVAKILRSPALAGMVVTNGDVLRGDDGLPLVFPEEGLIDVDKWHRLQAALDSRRGVRAPAEPRTARALLSGLLFDVDGQPLYSARANGTNPRRFDRYASRTLNGMKGVSVKVGAIDSFVEKAILRVVGHMEEVRPVVVTPAQDPAQLATVRAEIQKALAGMADPSADVVALATRLQSLRAKETELLSASSEEVIELVPTGRKIREAYEAAQSTDERRQILAGPVDHIVVMPGLRGKYKPIEERVHIVWKR